jgi:hypothetical protein
MYTAQISRLVYENEKGKEKRENRAERRSAFRLIGTDLEIKSMPFDGSFR